MSEQYRDDLKTRLEKTSSICAVGHDLKTRFENTIMFVLSDRVGHDSKTRLSLHKFGLLSRRLNQAPSVFPKSQKFQK